MKKYTIFRTNGIIYSMYATSTIISNYLQYFRAFSLPRIVSYHVHFSTDDHGINMFDYKKLKKYRGRNAVSPVVATLILIIVAIVGAVAVGLIVSGIGTQTGKQANGSGAASGSKPELIVGGSTTLFPAVVQGAAAFAASTGINVNVTQGGSGAGMTGVALGVLDIGDASSYSAVTTGISQFPSADLTANEVGGSGVVVIMNLGAGNLCTGITKAALIELYSTTTYAIPACVAGKTIISATANANSTALVAGAGLTGVSRSDLPSGTEDTFCGLVGTPTCETTSNNAVALPGVTAVGNPGVLAYVQSHTGTIGFVDLGFAEGTTQTAQGVTIAQVYSVADTTTDVPTACTTTAQNCYALPSATTAGLHSYIDDTLSDKSVVYTGCNGCYYPDYAAAAGVTGLTRTFWMVTKGPADAEAQQFITFMQSPANQGYWNSQGYFSIYQITPITPP